MNFEDVREAIKLAREFLARAEKIPGCKSLRDTRIPCGKLSASVRRASLDLSTSLAEMRRGAWK